MRNDGSLSKTEKAICHWVRMGYSDAEIAEQIGRSKGYVKNRLSGLYRYFGLNRVLLAIEIFKAEEASKTPEFAKNAAAARKEMLRED